MQNQTEDDNVTQTEKRELTGNDLKPGAFYEMHEELYRAVPREGGVDLYASDGEPVYRVAADGSLLELDGGKVSEWTVADLNEVQSGEIHPQLVVAGRPFVITDRGTQAGEEEEPSDTIQVSRELIQDAMIACNRYRELVYAIAPDRGVSAKSTQDQIVRDNIAFGKEEVPLIANLLQDALLSSIGSSKEEGTAPAPGG